ncbi:hypothetical protein TD95_001756 [Thielaviopsis punctulata]|uniref:VPS9 domain-containing protein n=1 Tax=Thielaviopsis punctulata TaxID=72032 RepID=A0A0F4Z879_9PEZI|nr:hypothetical protein TD95_001756 [Thielaviopsis punctulata]
MADPASQPAPESLLDSTDADLAASISTLRPSTPPAAPMTHLEPEPYTDPTPPTPEASTPTSRNASKARRANAASPSRSGYISNTDGHDAEPEDGAELQSIMLQFSEDGPKPTEEEVMSPRLEIASPLLGMPSGSGFGAQINMGEQPSKSPNKMDPAAYQYPPRKSSLEPLSSGQLHGLGLQQPIQPSSTSTVVVATPTPTTTSFSTPNYDAAPKTVTRARETSSASDDIGPPVPPKDDSDEFQEQQPLSPVPSTAPSVHAVRPPPPEADPEPTLPFDFQRFLEQLRHRKADPIARYLKSFLNEFGKKQWMVHEQVKIISDFLAFIANKMALCDVWRDVSDAEFDNAREGMEKLVMNRLYTQTFSPAIPPPPSSKNRNKRLQGERPVGPGRRGQHQEDVERDEILTQKINIYSWVRPEHLDIPSVSESGQRFFKLAQNELLKIRTYRAPRDKIICVLNCCKVIFGLLKHFKSDTSADSFMPMLIYVVLQSNPEHLVSNVQYILRFRNQEKLSGEAGYYLSSLMGVIQFVENMDRTTLTISDEEFEKNVEEAVSAIAEKHRLESPPLPPLPPGAPTSLAEKVTLAVAGSALAGASSSSRQTDAGSSSATAPSTPKPAAPLTPQPADPASPMTPDQPAPLATLFQTIQKPLTTFGRTIFGDDPGSPASPPPPPPPPLPRRISGMRLVSSESRMADAAPLEAPFTPEEAPVRGAAEQGPARGLSAEEAAARQASAEAAEAQRLQRAEHADVVDTLAGMFPDLDRDIISDVVYEKQGRVGLAVDACLALST